MRRSILAAGLMIALASAAPAQEAEIQSTIDSQLGLFAADDFAGAFEFASPNLQRLFQTPENFRRMVTQGYPMVWRYDDVEFLDLREEAGSYWQKVRITDEVGRVHLLDYRMLETPEGWRINGVKILDSSELSA